MNNVTFDLIVAIENELRTRIHQESEPEFTDGLKKEIAESENVQFFWLMLNVEWEEESGAVLLEMIVNQMKIRGFSTASASETVSFDVYHGCSSHM